MRLTLLAVGLVALVARVTVFTEGGTVGAWASVILFWACLLVALALWLNAATAERRSTGSSEPIIRWSLGALCLLAFTIGGLSDNDAVESASRVVLLLGLIVLAGASIARWQSRRPA